MLYTFEAQRCMSGQYVATCAALKWDAFAALISVMVRFCTPELRWALGHRPIQACPECFEIGARAEFQARPRIRHISVPGQYSTDLSCDCSVPRTAMMTSIANTGMITPGPYRSVGHIRCDTPVRHTQLLNGFERSRRVARHVSQSSIPALITKRPRRALVCRSAAVDAAEAEGST